MRETARGVLLNFVHMIELYGMIPNGGRTYYTNRYNASQTQKLIYSAESYVILCRAFLQLTAYNLWFTWLDIFTVFRSQPPLFIQMVQEYVEFTGDIGFVK